jgi:antirestriction protein ArdC
MKRWRFRSSSASPCSTWGNARGLPEGLAVAAPPPEPGLIEPRVEALIKATGIDFRIGGSRAFYVLG